MPKTNTILEQITNLEDRRRSSSNQNKSYEVLKRNEIILKCPESKNTRSISEIFEEYFKKFHFIYFQTFCETLCSDVIKHIGEFHKNKLNVYFSFEDQIKELELLTTGDTGNIQEKLENLEQKMIIQTMVQSIISDRDLKLKELEKDISTRNLIVRPNINYLNERENLAQINEEFLNSFVEMLK